MNPQIPKSLKTSKASGSTPLPPKSSTLTSHFAMIELKQRILSSIAKLSDRDTHHIAVEDLESIIQAISSDGASMLLNCLYDASGDPKPAVKKEALRLIALLCTAHGDATAAHLTKIIGCIVRRLKDSDSGVRDSCRDAIGALAGQYLRGEGDGGGLWSVVSLFVKPLFETMGEEKKAIQAGAAMCMARMVECAVDAPASVFQKLCPRICKYLNSQNVLAKAALLSVVASLSQAGAIAQQNMPTLLQSIHECLESSDWTTRKAAADTLTVLASHSSHLIAEKASSTISALERCRFDKVKPVRDSMTEALQVWKKIADKGGDANPDSPNIGSCDEKASDSGESTAKKNSKKANPSDGKLEAANEASTVSSTDSQSDTKGSNAADKTVAILKKAPTLSNKEVNPEFFQKLETRSQGDLPVEIVVPSRPVNSSKSEDGEKMNKNDATYRSRSSYDGSIGLGDGHVSSSARYEITESGHTGVPNKQRDVDDSADDKWTESRAFKRKELIARDSDINDRVEVSQRDQYNSRVGEFRNGHIEGSFVENKGNWMTIQKQLSQLERQQTHLMNMLQDFMGGSHDSMVTLENRVRGLERIIEDMQRDLAISSGRRSSNFMKGFEGTSGRPLGKYNGLSGREGEGRGPFAERFLPSDGMVSGVRGRDQPWRSEVSDLWDSFSYGPPRNGSMGSRRTLGGSIQSDGRPSRLENEGDQIGTRRAWDKGPGRIRLGEGPSARSVWHASKDEATLEAIRVAGDDKTSRPGARMHLPELNAEALGNSSVPRQDQGQAVWNNVMDTLHMGNLEMAYAEVLSSGDDVLLVKLMDRSGPVMDQLPDEIVIEVLHAVRQFLLEQSLVDICLSWIQQLVELVIDNGPDVFGISIENKRELLLTLREAASVIDLPQDWEGALPDQLMLQLASAWGIDLQ